MKKIAKSCTYWRTYRGGWRRLMPELARIINRDHGYATGSSTFLGLRLILEVK